MAWGESEELYPCHASQHSPCFLLPSTTTSNPFPHLGGSKIKLHRVAPPPLQGLTRLSLQSLPGLLITLTVSTRKPWPPWLCSSWSPSCFSPDVFAQPSPSGLPPATAPGFVLFPPTVAWFPESLALGHLFSRGPQRASETHRLSHFPRVEPSPGQT